MKPEKPLGLRVDCCTFRGLRDGLPRILEVLQSRSIRATIFAALGPDRSGRALLRLLTDPAFRAKMLRTRAARMYGLRTALYGVLLPPPRPGRREFEILVRAKEAGHEVGLHGWDHRGWQDSVESWTTDRTLAEFEAAWTAYRGELRDDPPSSAAPAWWTTERALLIQERYGFLYASDVRGTKIFRPFVRGTVLRTPQIPVTLPTLDEALGVLIETPDAFPALVSGRLRAGTLNVLAVHAEAEGRRYRHVFERLLDRLLEAGWSPVPLGSLLELEAGEPPVCRVGTGRIAGRHSNVVIESGEEAATSA